MELYIGLVTYSNVAAGLDYMRVHVGTLPG